MLQCFSFDHRASSFSLLERLSLSQQAITDAVTDPGVASGAVVLATCNRFEIYLDSEQDQRDVAVALLSAHSGATGTEIRDALDHHADDQAAEHLFSVASGLKSAAIGEEEIAGQVRRAHTTAQREGTLTDGLERLFQSATRTSRTVKHRTGIRGTGPSLVRLALRIAESRIPDWDAARVLLIGTGAYAGATIAALRSRGAADISVFSPSGRAEAYAARHELTAVPQDGFADALAAADLVLACSRTEEPLLTPADLRLRTRTLQSVGAPTAGRGSSQLLVDLGMPRNIDPDVALLPGVELLDLETIAKHAPVAELGVQAEAEEIVRRAAGEFAADQAELDTLPTLLALREHVMTILEDELCRTRKGQSDAESSAEVEMALRRLTGKLLHQPMTRIRSLGREGRAAEATEAISALFGIDEADTNA